VPHSRKRKIPIEWQKPTRPSPISDSNISTDHSSGILEWQYRLT
jgi:hypothetical protein